MPQQDNEDSRCPASTFDGPDSMQGTVRDPMSALALYVD
jgi:hypothetical protein